MISTGGHYRGPELKGSRIEKLLNTAGLAVIQECGHFVGGKDVAGPDRSPRPSGRTFEVGSAPALNVVFYVPGSLGDFDIPRIEASRFSRKQKLLLVAVPVSREVAESGGSVDFVIGALRQAVAIAAEVFAKKNVGTFDSAKAEAIIEKVRAAMAAQAG